jgi:hypothetical protein
MTAESAPSAEIASGGTLSAPLGMKLVPNGDIVMVNGSNGRAIEFTEQGRPVAAKTLIKGGAGDLFGIALDAEGNGLEFVDDGTNALDVAEP